MFYKIKENGYAKVSTDECPEDPRSNCEPVGTFYTFCRRLRSPDKHDFYDFDSFLEDMGCEYTNLVGVIQQLAKKGFIALPVFLMDHSARTYKASLDCKDPFCRFHMGMDSGLVGIIYVSREKVRTEMQINRVSAHTLKQIYNNLESEVDEWSAYANGDVLYIESFDEAGNTDVACGGFYGDGATQAIQQLYGIDAKDIIELGDFNSIEEVFSSIKEACTC